MIYLVPLLAPALLFGCALFGRSTRTAEWGALAALAIVTVSAVILALAGSGTSPLIGAAGLGLSTRLDMLSIVMLLLVAFIGWIVLRYSKTYLDREPGQDRFMALMCATLASVLLLVQSGNLVQLVAAWIATGFFLQKLLLFYADCPGAIRAARKKLWVTRLSEVSLIAAVIILFWTYGTGDIATILLADHGTAAVWAAGLLALAAILKSAQFPSHSWLTEVMEAPTPVSALLHAGVINAGGFLLIRFADVMLSAPIILAILAMIGGLTALFGGIVMLTQSAVKTSLAWSTIAQMGFMILQCGLALFPLALLHIVAHSLYKAHAFLSSGTAVDVVAATRRPGPVAIPNAAAVGRAFLVALAIYAIIGTIFGLTGKSVQAIALGAILIFGVAYLLAQGLADAAPRALTKLTAGYALAATTGYFALQSLSEWMMASTLPATPAPGPLEWALMIIALLSFGGVAVAQAMLPLWAHHPVARGLRVHITNGFYINAMFDRLINGWSVKKSS
ncbi:proton-conducting transporter membrane subunit [Pseudaestuariivita rosea]|uniref:proton-conducting transporter transmembrane domain-containing protein n=1 Tax=Pseudaestuariivita rosea TaxID=2763263 RepID=UPI001ABAC600|nr:proton-conducting transporter membrane subunit [Pseudaestuariivita rosea]